MFKYMSKKLNLIFDRFDKIFNIHYFSTHISNCDEEERTNESLVSIDSQNMLRRIPAFYLASKIEFVLHCAIPSPDTDVLSNDTFTCSHRARNSAQ